MRNGRALKSTEVMSSETTRTPKRCACSRIRSMSSGPVICSGKPGKFSMSVVDMSCPPGMSVPTGSPSKTTGFRFARAA
jgi:hypothetical protein